MRPYLVDNWIAIAALGVSLVSAISQWWSAHARRPRIGVHADGMMAFETHDDEGRLQSINGGMVLVTLANLGDRPLRVTYVSLVLVKRGGWRGDKDDLVSLFPPEFVGPFAAPQGTRLDEIIEPQQVVHHRLWIAREADEPLPVVRAAVELLSGTVVYSRIVFGNGSIKETTPRTPSLLRRKWQDSVARPSKHLAQMARTQGHDERSRPEV